jgi:hypothetical protein
VLSPVLKSITPFVVDVEAPSIMQFLIVLFEELLRKVNTGFDVFVFLNVR